jgi:uncharacterized protein
MIEKLGLQEIAYIESDTFPPVVIVQKDRPHSPVRIYGNRRILVLASEIPIPYSLIHGFSRSLMKWFKVREISMVVPLGGLANPRRDEIEKPQVYGLGTHAKAEEILKKNGIVPFHEGLIVGPNGILLRDCMKSEIPGMYLMADSHYKYPDPGAAVSLLEKLNSAFDLRIDLQEIKEKAEEIKISARDLMKRTGQSMDEMEKIREKEIPVMYR